MALRISVAGASVVALVLCGGCVDIVGSDFNKYVERVERRYQVSGTPDVAVSTFDGSIEIRAWDKEEVEVVVEKRAASKEAAADILISAEQRDGNRITVNVTAERASHFGIHFHNSRSARLIVSAPAKSNIFAKSGDGAIDITRISGSLELRSGDGSIKGTDLGGEVRAHTGDGAITLEGVSGKLDVDTGDGSVRANGKLTSVRVRSGDGAINVRANGGSAAESDWDITTGDGSVTLELPDGFDAELDAHTGDGGIEMRGITLSNVSGTIGRNSVRGRLGSGGHNVRVRTGDGSISLRKTLSAEATPSLRP
jgi:hypothetical protein